MASLLFSGHTRYLLNLGLCSNSSPDSRAWLTPLPPGLCSNFNLTVRLALTSPFKVATYFFPTTIPKPIPPMLAIPLTLLYFFLFFLQYLTIYLLSLLFTAYFSLLDYKQHKSRDSCYIHWWTVQILEEYLANSSLSVNMCWRNETK